MIILIKQLLNDALQVEKVQLNPEANMQITQIFDFDADLIVGTCPSDSALVLELAMFCKVSFALYLPDLKQILALLTPFKSAKYRQISKLIYLHPDYFNEELALLQDLAEDFLLQFDGDYQEMYENLAFDVRERELDFLLDG